MDDKFESDLDRETLFPELIAPADPMIEAPSEGAEQGGGRQSSNQNQLAGQLSREEFTIFERLDYLWRTHGYITGNFRLADAKAAVTIVVATSLVGSLFAAGLHRSFTGSLPRYWSFDGWLDAISFLMLTSSVLLAAWSVHPRLRRTKNVDFIYWENILSHNSAEAYWNHFRSDSANDLERTLCTNIYTIAGLCRAKFRCLLVANWIAVFGGVLGGILLLLRK